MDIGGYLVLMKKSKIKIAIKNAIRKHYRDKGLTATAFYFQQELLETVDKEYQKLHKRK